MADERAAGIPNTGSDPLGSAVPKNVKDELNKTPDVKAKEAIASAPHNPIMDKAPLPGSDGARLGVDPAEDMPGGGKRGRRVDMPGMAPASGDKIVLPQGRVERRPGEKHRK